MLYAIADDIHMCLTQMFIQGINQPDLHGNKYKV